MKIVHPEMLLLCYKWIISLIYPEKLPPRHNNSIPNMPKAMPLEDPRYMRAAKTLVECPKLKVPAAMLGVRFPADLAFDRVAQMRVRRLVQSMTEADASTAPSSVSITSSSPMSSVTTSSSCDASVASSARSIPAPKAKQVRKTPIGMQQVRSNTKAADNHRKRAHKAATTQYAAEKKKPKGEDGKLSAEAVTDSVNEMYETDLKCRTIERYVLNGQIGTSSICQGKPSHIPEYMFKTIASAFESYIKINQVNGKNNMNTFNALRFRVQKACHLETTGASTNLMHRLLAETAVDILGTSCDTVEERRILWTTYNNLKCWFLNWGNDLVELGFAHKNLDGDIVIPEEQLGRIVNFDETCLSLDGSNGSRGC